MQPASSERLVHLRAGLIVPIAAFDLVLECERRGLKLWLDNQDVLVEGRDITPDVVADLKRWKPHVRLLLAYIADDSHLRDGDRPVPELGPILITRRHA